MLKHDVERLAIENMPFIMRVLDVKGFIKIVITSNDDDHKFGAAHAGVYGDMNKELGLNAERLHNVDQVLEVQCHEMIHAHQHERGDLRNVPDGIEWKGKVFNLFHLMYAREKHIERALPWEQEAYGEMFIVADKVRRLKAQLTA